MPNPMPRPLVALLLAAAALWHVFAILAPPRTPPPPDTAGRDYASYHYALLVAAEGGNPYDTKSLSARAREDGTRKKVHPFFYPPPFLLSVAWALPLDLMTAFDVWFVLQEVCLLATVLVLAWWWRPLGAPVLPTLAVAMALTWGVGYSAELGQANPMVALLVAVGLAVHRDRPVLGGIAVGMAAMAKMSPALFLLWWLGAGRYRAVAAAVATAVVTSLLALPLVDLDTQVHFYRDVLPGFGSGDYNGLTIKIAMFGNHSLPNLYDQWLPGVDNRLSDTARTLSTLTTLALGGLALGLGTRSRDDLATDAAQLMAVWVGTLLVPVYTYEHHLMYAVPGLALVTVLALRRELPVVAVAAVGYVWALFAVPLPDLRSLAVKHLGPEHLMSWPVQEAKSVALLLLLVVLLVAALRPGAQRTGQP